MARKSLDSGNCLILHFSCDLADGTYFQSEPIGLAGTYAYVGGRPTMLADPKGLEPEGASAFIKTLFPNSSTPMHPPADCSPKCLEPIAVTFQGMNVCPMGNMTYVQAMGAAGLIPPRLQVKYSGVCLAALGLVGKVGGVKAGNALVGKAGAVAATAAETAQGWARLALGGIVDFAEVYKHPVTTAVLAPFAVQKLFEECECHED